MTLAFLEALVIAGLSFAGGCLAGSGLSFLFFIKGFWDGVVKMLKSVEASMREQERKMGEVDAEEVDPERDYNTQKKRWE